MKQRWLTARGAVLGLVCVLVCGAFDWPYEAAERKRMGAYAPASLQQTPTGLEPQRPMRTLKVRVYVEPLARAGNWQLRLRAIFDRANRLVGPGFGLQFEVESFRKWERPAAAEQLVDLLPKLHALDAGTDVDLVVGITSPLQIEAVDMHEAGRAEYLSKHMLLRPLSNLAEERSFREAFSALDESERQNFLELRRNHKEVIFFLHEWAHTLGAMHDREPNWIMAPAWSREAGAFSYPAARIIEIAVRHRLGPNPDLRAEARELKAFVTSAAYAEWGQADRKVLLSWMDYQVQSGLRAMDAPAPTAPAPVRAGASAELRAGLTAATDLIKRGLADEAEPLLVKAQLAAEADANTQPDVWAYLSSLDLQAGAITAGERAAERAGAAAPDNFKAQFALLRRRVGLARGNFLVGSTVEVTYVTSFRQIEAALVEGQLDRAETFLISRPSFASTSGFLGLSCELALLRHRTDKALPTCTRAVQADRENTTALLLLAQAQAIAGQRKAAQASLQQAQILDPEHPMAATAAAFVRRRFVLRP